MAAVGILGVRLLRARPVRAGVAARLCSWRALRARGCGRCGCGRCWPRSTAAVARSAVMRGRGSLGRRRPIQGMVWPISFSMAADRLAVDRRDDGDGGAAQAGAAGAADAVDVVVGDGAARRN